MVQSSVLMSISDPMAVPRAPESLLLNQLMMHAMPFSSSTVMTGRVAHLRSVKIALLVLLPSVAEALADAVDSVVALEVEVATVDVVALGAALVEVVVAMVAAVDMVVLPVVAMMVVVLPLLPIPLPTTQLLAPNEARSSTFAT